jgi:hypothetical protein
MTGRFRDDAVEIRDASLEPFNFPRAAVGLYARQLVLQLVAFALAALDEAIEQ